MIGTLKVIYKFNTIKNTIKTPAVIFAEIDKPILKLIWNYKWSSIAETILKRAKLENSYSPISKLNHKLQWSRIHGTVSIIHTYIYKIENLEINSYITHGQLISSKGSKITYCGKEESTNGLRTSGYPHAKDWSWTPVPHHIQKSTQNVSKT